MATTRRQFPREFKLEAVRLAKESGKPPAQIAREIITHGAHEHDAEAQAYNAAFELPNSDMRGLPRCRARSIGCDTLPVRFLAIKGTSLRGAAHP
jgi:hypothetical protein